MGGARPGCQLRAAYFHGDHGAGLGASHQTGRTGLIADLIRRKYGAVRSTGEDIAELASNPSPNMIL